VLVGEPRASILVERVRVQPQNRRDVGRYEVIWLRGPIRRRARSKTAGREICGITSLATRREIWRRATVICLCSELCIMFGAPEHCEDDGG
jgi:hypothetical protein